MKARLITNGVLSLISLIAVVIAIVSFVHVFNKTVNNIDINGRLKHHVSIGGGLAGIGWAIIVSSIAGIANLVMGILTLSMKKDESIAGLTIASGVLAILCGLFGVNAIVSFIAVYKMSS